MLTVESKICTKCGEDKPLEAYRCAARGKYGRRSDCRACEKAYQDRTRDHHRARGREWYANNRELRKAYRAERRDLTRDYLAGWRSRNPEYMREWRNANPEYVREAASRRRALILDRTTGPVDTDALWQHYGGNCALCYTKIDRSLRHPDPMSASLDHVVPLSKGGTHTQDNLQWAHLTCNVRKGNRD